MFFELIYPKIDDFQTAQRAVHLGVFSNIAFYLFVVGYIFYAAFFNPESLGRILHVAEPISGTDPTELFSLSFPNLLCLALLISCLVWSYLLNAISAIILASIFTIIFTLSVFAFNYYFVSTYLVGFILLLIEVLQINMIRGVLHHVKSRKLKKEASLERVR